jgi:hypothetical protein
MSTPEKKKKYNKGGNIVRFEPQGLQLINSDPTIRASFEQARCVRFCEKLQGYNMQVTKEFSLNFNGVDTKIGDLQFQVTEESISTATEIPSQGEKWFKGMPLDLSFYHDFLKPEYKNQNFSATVPREFILEHYGKLLRVVQRYFTCEGRFNRVYQYHIRLLMHFTGKNPLNLPFYLYRSLGKMSDRVQEKTNQIEPSLFHFSLIKLLVLEELRKHNKEWDSFLVSAGIATDIFGNPQDKEDTPSSA